MDQAWFEAIMAAPEIFCHRSRRRAPDNAGLRYAPMFVLTIIYLLLVLIRPQDYPEFQSEGAVPWQQLALVGAALFWAMSPRKNFAAPQYQLLLRLPAGADVLQRRQRVDRAAPWCS